MGLGFVGWWGWGHRKVTRACPLTQTQVHGWSREVDGPCHGPFIPLLFCPQYLLRLVSARPVQRCGEERTCPQGSQLPAGHSLEATRKQLHLCNRAKRCPGPELED